MDFVIPNLHFMGHYCFLLVLFAPSISWSQQATVRAAHRREALTQTPLTGGEGTLYLSQFANPALRGALYMTPNTFRIPESTLVIRLGDTESIAEEGVLDRSRSAASLHGRGGNCIG